MSGRFWSARAVRRFGFATSTAAPTNFSHAPPIALRLIVCDILNARIGQLPFFGGQMKTPHAQSIFGSFSMLVGYFGSVIGTILFFSGHPLWGVTVFIFGTAEMGFALKYNNDHPI
jgi:hypothetical protein